MIRILPTLRRFRSRVDSSCRRVPASRRLALFLSLAASPRRRVAPSFRRLSLCLLLTGLPTLCDLSVSNSDRAHTITGQWQHTGPVTFTGSAKPYESDPDGLHGALRYVQSQWDNGLHIANGQGTTITNSFVASPGLVLGVRGTDTRFTYNGDMDADDGMTFVNISITEGATLTIGPEARIDLINDAYYTRQIWVWGDGTGTFEVDESFVADRTEGGTVTAGAASYRFRKNTFVSHHTQGLPSAAWPHCMNCPEGQLGYNGHLVFEDAGPSRWIVATNDQVYNAALWLWTDLTIETRADLTHTGFAVQLQSSHSYELEGAFQTLDENLTITKEGPASLILAGEQAYETGTTLEVNEGTVVFDTDAAGGAFRPDGSPGGQTLTVNVADRATVICNAAPVRIGGLTMSSAAALEVSTAGRLEVSGRAAVAGTLRVALPPDTSLHAGTELTLFDWNPTGTFDVLDLPPNGTWDTSRLYSDGVLVLADGIVGRTSVFIRVVAPARRKPHMVFPQELDRPYPGARRGYTLSGRSWQRLSEEPALLSQPFAFPPPR